MRQRIPHSIATILGFLLLLLASAILLPTPDFTGGLPQANGQAAKLTSALQPGWLILAGSQRHLHNLQENELAQALHRTVAKFVAQKAGSAWLYLFLKNIAPEGATVVIPFSGLQLTYPELYADSGKEELSFLMRGREPAVERLTYLGRMPVSEYWLRRILPLYAWREPMAKKARELLTDEAVYGPSPQISQQENATTNAENALWDFPTQVNTSYLPLIAEAARKKNIRVLFIEIPGMRAPNEKLAQSYTSALKAYLQTEFTAEYARTQTIEQLPQIIQEKVAQ